MFANILEPYILNIFTDASIRKISDNECWSCAGAIAVCGNTIIADDYKVYQNRSSNYTELKAIELGINLALNIITNNPNLIKVNLFSDSQISIFGIRDRIFNWSIINNTLAGYGNKIIMNQDIFLEIVHTVINCKLNISFYHQKGHSDQSSISVSRNTFIKFNRVAGATEHNVDFEFIKYINRYNQMVDAASRKILYHIDKSQNTISPIVFNIASKNSYNELLEEYKKYINGGNN